MKSFKRLCTFLVVAVIAVFAVIGASENYKPLKTSGSVPEKLFTQEITPSDEIRMGIVEGSVTPLGVKVAYINESQRRYEYGEEFSLQKLVDGQWYTMSWINDNVGFLAVAYLLEPGRVEKEYSWRLMHGEIEPGQYRIVTSANPENDYDSNVFLEATFSIE